VTWWLRPWIVLGAVQQQKAVQLAPQPAPTQAATPSHSAASQQQVDFLALQSEVEKKLKKLKNEKVSAELAISQGIYLNLNVIPTNLSSIKLVISTNTVWLMLQVRPVVLYSHLVQKTTKEKDPKTENLWE